MNNKRPANCEATGGAEKKRRVPKTSGPGGSADLMQRCLVISPHVARSLMWHCFALPEAFLCFDD